jgi:AcrR family transcriptional regulator
MAGMGFQRARSEEQREARRRAILTAAAAMLAEMPVSALTLNELSRRVGLAKSNVLRYFESREDVLLELLDRSAREWVAVLAREIATGVDPAASVRVRTDRVAALFAASAAAHPELLDLFAAQGGVLEHNVSAAVVLRHKRAMYAALAAIAEVLTGAVPEVGEQAAAVCEIAVTLAGALYVQTRQSAACAVAYQADPALVVLRIELAPTLESAVATYISGILARR